MNDENRNLPPRITSALAALQARLRRRFFLHGLGWLVAAVCGLLAVHYALDRLLALPPAVRLVLLAGIAVVLFRGLRRRLLYPLGRPFRVADMALLVERGFPGLEQEMISAVQLDPDDPRGDSAALIRTVHENAARDIEQLDLGTLLRARRTLRVWAFAGGFALVLAAYALIAPQSFGIWLGRVFGSSAPYPRQTFLAIEIPEGQGNYRVTNAGGTDGPIRVALARGADLPINVDVTGKIPPIVDLHVESLGGRAGRTHAMSRRGASHFRHVFRRLLQPVRLHATGGDDPGTRFVDVRILTPPAATDLSVRIEPPEYTGLAPVEREGGLVEALPASKVIVSFRSTEPLEQAGLHFQEAGGRLRATVSQPVEGGGAPRWVARFDMPEKADRYRIQLEAKNGLTQLSPGLHSVVPKADRKPRVQLFSPGASLQAITPKSAFPLRLVATDDYGLTKIELVSRSGQDAPPHTAVLWDVQAARGQDPEIDRKRQSYLRLFAPKDLLPGAERQPREGDRLSLELTAFDNRQPEPQASVPQSFKIDLLDVEELRRRLQARLRSTRRSVERALKVQGEHQSRVETFLGEMSEGSGASESRRKLGLTAAEAGQQRVRGFLMQIRGDLGEVLDAHLFNSFDPSPAVVDVVAAYVRYYEERPDAPATDPGFWVELDAARKAGRIGSLDLIGKLNTMFMIAHRVLEEAIQASLRSLAAASTAENANKFHGAMRTVQQAQGAVVAGLNELLALLEDWNDYQDVVRMARRVRDSQRDLMERIRQGR